MSRELLQMALTSLEYHTAQTRPIHDTIEAMEALRTELAKPDPVLLSDRPNEFGTLHT